MDKEAKKKKSSVMEESKCGKIPPCYGGKKFRIHEEFEKIKAWDKTHDMIYELNRQMCDIDKHLSEAGYFGRICEGQVKARKKLIMEEKKTIKEWKEAFAELYKAMRKELGASDLDVKIYQNEVKPIVNFDIHF